MVKLFVPADRLLTTHCQVVAVGLVTVPIDAVPVVTTTDTMLPVSMVPDRVWVVTLTVACRAVTVTFGAMVSTVNEDTANPVTPLLVASTRTVWLPSDRRSRLLPETLLTTTLSTFTTTVPALTVN